MTRLWKYLSAGVALAAATIPARAQPGRQDSVAAVATVERFHAAVRAGDTAAVARLLAPEALVLESGVVETRAEYLRHHLAEDVAFVKAIPGERELLRADQAGGVAWVTSRSRAAGQLEGRTIDSDGAELMVLKRANDGWQIVAIHWSSRRRRL